MKLWIDDLRPAPEGYVWCKSVDETKEAITKYEQEVESALDEYDFPSIELWNKKIELIDLGNDGDDYINLLDWLEETDRNYPIRIHSANPVGVQNMRRIIQRNNWKEVF